MIISEDKKFIFVAIPKTGTTSIESALKKYEDTYIEGMELFNTMERHYGFKDIEHLNLPYYKFCFFRNPWGRAVSGYFYEKKRGEPTALGKSRDNTPFEETILDIDRDPGVFFKPQTYWITNDEGLIYPDIHIYKFEEMDASWLHICKTLGLHHTPLPHKNKSSHTHYSTYYTDETRDIVAKHHQLEIEMMGYTFKDER